MSTSTAAYWRCWQPSYKFTSHIFFFASFLKAIGKSEHLFALVQNYYKNGHRDASDHWTTTSTYIHTYILYSTSAFQYSPPYITTNSSLEHSVLSFFSVNKINIHLRRKSGRFVHIKLATDRKVLLKLYSQQPYGNQIKTHFHLIR